MSKDDCEESGFRIGETLPGTEWTIKGVLGRGGMGIVLDVVRKPGIRAAIKVVLPRNGMGGEVEERFMREVEVLASLEHPNIVRVQDWGRLPSGSLYLVMERLEGSTLRTVALRRAHAGRPLTARQVYEVARQICEGLRCAHTHDPPVVHRDLKPDNVFIHTPPFGEETVKLIDFGVAEWLGGGGLSSQSLVVGTPRYMSPEALRGDRVGPPADIYAAAMIVYESLTLRFPWNIDLRNMRQLKEAHTELPPIPPAQIVPWVPKAVEECLLRALSKYPEQRHENIGAFLRGLWALQFADDGTLLSEDVNTTIPTLGTLSLSSPVGPGESAAVAVAPAVYGTTDKEVVLGEPMKSEPSPLAAPQGDRGISNVRFDEASATSEDREPPSTPSVAGTPLEAAAGLSTSSLVSIGAAMPVSDESVSVSIAEHRTSTTRRRGALVGAIAAGIVVASVVGFSIRARPSKASGVAGMGIPAVDARKVAVSGIASSVASSSDAAVLHNTGVDGGMSRPVVVMEGNSESRTDLDGPRPNVGVSPLPSTAAVATVMATRDAGLSVTPISNGEFKARKVQGKGKAVPRVDRGDDGFDMLSGSP